METEQKHIPYKTSQEACVIELEFNGELLGALVKATPDPSKMNRE